MCGCGNAPRGAGRAIEHPGRDLQPPIGCLAREAAAEHIPVSLLDYLMNVNITPAPGMPGIKKLPLPGPVGVVVALYNTVRPHSAIGNLPPAIYATLSAPAMQRDGTLRALGGSAPRPVAPPSQAGSNDQRTLPIAG